MTSPPSLLSLRLPLRLPSRLPSLLLLSLLVSSILVGQTGPTPIPTNTRGSDLIGLVNTNYQQIQARLACAGTPGTTSGRTGQICYTPAGNIYICTNVSNCTTAVDWTALVGGGAGMVWPTLAGIPSYNGALAWVTSYTVGNAANNIPQLDGAGKVNLSIIPDLSSTYIPGTKVTVLGSPGLDTNFATEKATRSAIAAISIPISSSATPLMNGVGAVGTATGYSHGDHIHPSDTSREPSLGNPVVDGSSLVSTISGTRSWSKLNVLPSCATTSASGIDLSACSGPALWQLSQLSGTPTVDTGSGMKAVVGLGTDNILHCWLQDGTYCDVSVSTSGQILVNSIPVTTANFNSTTPAAEANFTNCKVRSSGSNVSIECPTPTYAALADKPTIPTLVSQLTNDTNFISSASYGIANGLPQLDSGAKVRYAQIPWYNATNATQTICVSGTLAAGNLLKYGTTGCAEDSGYKPADFLGVAIVGVLDQWTESVAHSQTLTGAGGTGPYTITLGTGTFPTGLSIGGGCGTNTICGTPGSGTHNSSPFSLTFHIVDSAGSPHSSDKTLPLTVLAPAATVANPTFSPDGTSTYNSSQTVTISDATSGSTIFYCTDLVNSCNPLLGTQGTSVAMNVDATYLRSQATKTGLVTSAVSSHIYNFKVATPVPSTATGTQVTVGTVISFTVSPDPTSVTFYWTQGDGTQAAPTCSTTDTGSYTVTGAITIKVVGCKTGYQTSSVLTASYTTPATISRAGQPGCSNTTTTSASTVACASPITVPSGAAVVIACGAGNSAATPDGTTPAYLSSGSTVNLLIPSTNSSTYTASNPTSEASIYYVLSTTGGSYTPTCKWASAQTIMHYIAAQVYVQANGAFDGAAGFPNTGTSPSPITMPTGITIPSSRTADAVVALAACNTSPNTVVGANGFSLITSNSNRMYFFDALGLATGTYQPAYTTTTSGVGCSWAALALQPGN